MKQGFKYIISGLILLSLIAACAPIAATDSPNETTNQPIHLTISVRNFISFAPLFIARDEGYFAEQNLDVELIDFSSASSSETLPLLVAREIDAGGIILDVSVFNAILQGNNLKYVADRGFLDPNNCPTDAYVASKTILVSGELSNLAAIKGKNVGIQSPGGSPEYIMDVFLAQSGLTQDDIQTSLIPSPPTRIEGLKNGSLDVSVLSEPWITRAQTSDAGEVWVPFSDVIPNMSLGTIVFGPRILEDNPEAGTRFMIAYLKAVQQFSQGKTDRNVEIIADYTKLSPEDIKASCWTSYKPDGSIDAETTLAFQKWAVEKGYVDGPLDLEDFWAPQFIEEAQKNLSQ